MGYTTDFTGSFALDKPLAPHHAAYLRKFSETRRMARDATHISLMKDDTRLLANLPVGEQGGYFVGATGLAGQDKDGSILDYNEPPIGQPGLWCQWAPSDDGTKIQWDEGEKFYRYTEWLQYLLEHFLTPWGYSLSGWVRWSGEADDDIGVISVVDGKAVVTESETDRGASGNGGAVTTAVRAREALRAANKAGCGRALGAWAAAPDSRYWLAIARQADDLARAHADNDSPEKATLYRRAASLCVSAWQASRPVEEARREAEEALKASPSGFAYATALADAEGADIDMMIVAIATYVSTQATSEEARQKALAAVEALCRLRRVRGTKDGAA